MYDLFSSSRDKLLVSLPV